MKVILEQDVKNVGKAGAVVEVSDGYARNFLLPKKLAKMATAATINAARVAEAAEKHKKQVEAQQAKEAAQTLKGKEVRIKAKCGEGSRLFGAITSKEIAAAATEQLGSNFDKKNVEMESNIKELGTYDVVVRLYAGTTTTIKVIVEAE